MAFGGQHKMLTDVFDFFCTTCAEDNKFIEAVKYCVECSRYCCQSCTDAHKFPALRSHHLLDVSQGKQASGLPSILPEFPTERCSKHKGKVLDMYCEGHDVVGCCTCFVKDHKTHSHLKDMMTSMETAGKNRDMQLQKLYKTKRETLDKVTTFYKVLEAIIWKATEVSREQVEATCKDLETDILKEKHNVDNIYQRLRITDEKLKQSECNHAQRFVCTKMSKEILKEAEMEKRKHDFLCTTEISFVPNKAMSDHLAGLENIGQVHKEIHQKQDINKKQKQDLYKIQDTRNISIKLDNDSEDCYPVGCCAARANRLLVTDHCNKKLKCFDVQTLSVVDYCTLDSSPYDVCYISKEEVAVSCVNEKMIQFVSIRNQLMPTRQIKTSHQCYGIAYMDGKLYVTNSSASLYIYNMNGTLLKKISQDNNGNRLFDRSRHIAFNASGNMIFVGGGYNGLVCLDMFGEYLYTITDKDLSFADGVCADGRGSMFVVGQNSHNVVQFSEKGKKVGVVVRRGDGLHDPLSVCFHPGLNRMFAFIENSDVVKMYELR